ncbi:MAG: GH92 family glycosyl hydrolase [bacterium]|nr:GH92 family glycosyl hydrolase [bacterium]
MKNWNVVLLCALVACNSYAQIPELKNASDKAQSKVGSPKSIFSEDKLPYVNPFIGTGGHGHTYPGASAPFGMIQLSPDTRHDGWDGCSGYHYSDDVIYGFSHTHLSGTGVSDYGDLLIVPQHGSPRLDPGYQVEDGYGSTFSHDNETASPGYYSVHLEEPDIDVQLATTTRAGIHEYTFNKEKGKKFLLLDLDHRDRIIETDMSAPDDNTVQGYRISKAWAERQEFHFYLKTDVPFQKARMILKKGRYKMLLIFPKNTERVTLRVGISAVDIDGAKANLEKEIPNFDLNMVRASTERQWRQELNKIQFQNEDKEVMTNFYTALYHSYLNPNVFSDVDGRYRGYDGNIHELPNDSKNNYTVFSLWDTYRATHPLFTLTQVQRTNDFIRTFLRQFEQKGTLPIWELAGNETGCMIGYHSVSVIADAYTKGIQDYDAREAIKAMIATSMRDELGKLEYASQGFLGVSKEPESVSKTLEYAYNDFCIAEMIADYHQNSGTTPFNEDLQEYRKRSMNFINLYDPSTKFMRARRSGSWFSPFDPAEVNFNYTEANSWQYSLYTPHAVGVHTGLLGGKDSLEAWLDRLFTTPSDLSGRHQVDITGLIGQYAHGNEPSHHMAYLYNYTNAPEKTADYIHQISSTLYKNAPDGLSGNEDCGQMSSWYVLSALGLYQIAPGRPYYDFGTPLLNDGQIQFSGRNLRIKTTKESNNSKYIDKIMLNGKELKQRYIHHEQLTKGGELHYFLTDAPSANYRTYAMAPTIEEVPEDFVPVPHRIETERIFEEQAAVTLQTPLPAEIYFTTDGSDPKTSKTVQNYRFIPSENDGPVAVPSEEFYVSETTTVKAFAKDSLGNESAVVTMDLVKKNPNISIEIKSEYANQYAAYGDLTMIDGIRGGNEYRTGDWQGYWAQDLMVELTFKNPRTISEMALGCLEDTKSWIFLPNAVVFEGSTDGVNFEIIGINKLIHTATQVEPAKIFDFNFKLEQAKSFKKIRVTALNYGKCPEWHLGAGNDTWLFVDEIVLK